MGCFEYQGLKFNYRTTGKGIPFIFLHGMGGSIRQSEKLFQAPAGIRMIYMDQRGNGETPIGPLGHLTFEQMAEDVLAFAEHLKLERFILGGVSMGAAAASRLAVDHGDRVLGLVLVRPAWTHFPMDVEVREIYHKVAYLIEIYGDTREAKEQFKKWEAYRLLKKKAPSAAKSLLGHFEEKHIENNYEKFRILPEQSPFHNPGQLKQITCPVLVAATKKDPIHKYQYGLYHRDYIPDAELAELVPKSEDEKLHQTQLQNEIEGFLKRVGAFIQ